MLSIHFLTANNELTILRDTSCIGLANKGHCTCNWYLDRNGYKLPQVKVVSTFFTLNDVLCHYFPVWYISTT